MTLPFRWKSLLVWIIFTINGSKHVDAFLSSTPIRVDPRTLTTKHRWRQLAQSHSPMLSPATGKAQRRLSRLGATPAVITSGLVLAHVLGGTLGTPIVLGAIQSWYTKIDLPPWTPPNVLFGPVWTLLYGSMGFAVSRVVLSTTTMLTLPWYRQTSLQLWAVHYLLNILWAPVFFGWKRFRLAAWMNFGLLATLGATLFQWLSNGHVLSCQVLTPYALWLSFATVLNVEICRRNPGPYNQARFVTDLQKLQQQAAKNVGL